MSGDTHNPGSTLPPPFINFFQWQAPETDTALVAAASDLTISNQFVVRLNAPEPASAATRRAWDSRDGYGALAMSPEVVTPALGMVEPSSASSSTNTSPASTPTLPIADVIQPQGPPKWYAHPGNATRHVFGMPYALAGPSEGGSTLVQGQYTSVRPSPAWISQYPTSKSPSPGCQGYTMSIGVKQPENPSDYTSKMIDTTFKVLLDTGSNTTWLLGQDYCEVDLMTQPEVDTTIKPENPGESEVTVNNKPEASGGRLQPQVGDSMQRALTNSGALIGDQSADEATKPEKMVSHPPPDGSTVKVPGDEEKHPASSSAAVAAGERRYSAWLEEDPRDTASRWRVRRPFHRTIISNCLRTQRGKGSKPTSVPPKITAGHPTSLLQYADGSCVELVLPPDEYDVQLHQSYNWSSSASRAVVIDIGYRFAIAYAVSYKLDRIPIDGIVGLGLSETQKGFEKPRGGRSAQSFLMAVKQRVLAGTGATTGGAFGLAFFFALRSPTGSLKEHWMAYNECPITVNWSSEILVIPSDQIARDGSKQYSHWTIGLKAMKIVKILADGTSQDVPDGHLLLHRRAPAKVILDTGCSLSYVPTDMITQLKTATFKCSENTHDINNTDQPGSDPAFVVPENRLRGQNLWVEFQFVGRRETVVKVHCPIDPFLCTRNPMNPSTSYREGLLWNNDKLQGMKGEMIFGINFFQAMYVAMHWPPAPQRPYVRLAFQPVGTRDIADHRLPSYHEE